MKQGIINELVVFEISNGILTEKYPSNTELDLATAQEIIQKRLEVTNSKKFPTLIDATNVKIISREARIYLSKESSSSCKAIAFIFSSIFHKILLSTFLSFNKPEVPTKLFDEEEKAIKWLNQFK